MTEWFARSKSSLAIFFAALLLRVALLVAIGPWRPEVCAERLVIDDAREYFVLASNLAAHGVLSASSSPPWEPELRRTPGYPAFVAAIFRVAGPSVTAVLAIQVLLGALACVLTFQLGRRFFDEPTARLAAILHALDYSSILLNNLLLAETLFALVFATGLLQLIDGLRKRHLGRIAFSGCALGVAALVRPVAVYFPLFAALLFLPRMRPRALEAVPGNAPTHRRLLVAFAAAFVAVLAPWLARNLAVGGPPLVSSQQASVLRWALPTFFNPEGTVDEVDETVAEEDHDGSASDARKNSFTRDLGKYGAGLLRFFVMVGSSSYPRVLGLEHASLSRSGWKQLQRGDHWVLGSKTGLELGLLVSFSLYLLAVYAGALRSILRWRRTAPLTELSILFIAIGYFVLATASVAYDARYRMPVMPFLLLLAAGGVRFGRTNTSEARDNR